MPGARGAIGLWLRRLLLAALFGVALLFLGYQLFLHTPLGPWALNRRPERFRIHWDSASGLVPGRLEVEGLRLEGATRRIGWSLSVERGQGRIRLRDLFHRKLVIEGFEGQGVRASVARLDPPPSLPPAPRRRGAGRPGWTVEVGDTRLTDVGEVSLYGVRLAGAGEARGRCQFQIGGDFALPEATVRLTGARLFQGEHELARGVDVEARATITPFAVRRHPGLQAFDFTSGSLRASGSLTAVRPGPRAPADPGRLDLDLELERGRLAPGTRLAWSGALAPGTGGPTGPLRLAGGVEAAAGGPRLQLAASAPGFAIGGGAGHPPLFATGPVTLAAVTPETSLSRLLATARDLGRTRASSAAAFTGELSATDLSFQSARRRLAWRVAVERARGRIDLPALFDRRVVLHGLEGEGAVARLDLGPVSPAGEKKEGSGWSVEVADARVTGVREVAFGERSVAGEGTAELALTVAPGGVFTLRKGTLAIPSGRYRSGGKVVSRDLALAAEARLAPSAVPATAGAADAGAAAVLRRLSGRLELSGTVLSLGLLEKLILQNAPWLRLDARGRLAADLRLEEGRLTPGTSLSVRAARVAARLFDDEAVGTGSVTARVDKGSRGELRVGFDRFSVAARDGKPGKVLVRGRGLAVTAQSRDLDLAARPFSDLKAEVRLPSAEVPDLTAFAGYLPPATGVAILSGRGRAELGLTLDAAAQAASGRAALTAPEVRVAVQDLELSGVLALEAALRSSDLRSRRFHLSGSRLDLTGVRYGEIGAEADPGRTEGWWCRAVLRDGSMIWGRPLSLSASTEVRMKNADPILNLFARRRRFLGWFKNLLELENLEARGDLRVGDGAIVLSPLQVTGEKLDLRSRLRFSRQSKEGELFVRYGRLATGLELRDGRRTFHLRQPEEWFEGTSPRHHSGRGRPRR